MKKLRGSVSSSVSTAMLLAALPAGAAFSVQSRVDAGADPHYIRPYIRVHSDSSDNLQNYTINYYIYEATQPVVFVAPTTATPGVTVTVSRLPRTITGPQATTPTLDVDGQNANYVVQMRISANTPIPANGNFDIQFTLQAVDGRTFSQTDDWSYLGNTGAYAPNQYITITGGPNATGSAPVTDMQTVLRKAKEKIKHIVVIMQENRSFDNYFGTYPGADGVANAPVATAPFTCGVAPNTVTIPANYRPEHYSRTTEGDYPHFQISAKDILGAIGDTGALPITAYLANAVKNGDGGNPDNCSESTLHEVVGYHTAAEIPNYWKFAQNFVLQDKMFEAPTSWSPVSHLYMVSGWNADCRSTPAQPYQPNQHPIPRFDCQGEIAQYYTAPLDDGSNSYLWEDITNLFYYHLPEITWKYYEGEDWDAACATCSVSPINCLKPETDCNTANATFKDCIAGFWSPLRGFKTVNENGDQIDNIVKLKSWTVPETGHIVSGFYEDVFGNPDNFPSVSWIVPGIDVSEHAGWYGVDLKHGEAFVTSIIQAIMSNPPLWESAAIFVSWDDWGGFYDHVRPPVVEVGVDPIDPTKQTSYGYGIRVPGLTISPWVQQQGYIDNQVLSHDAYLKLMEDIFLGGERIGMGNGVSTGDARPSQREEAPQLGDLLYEFDFFRTPMSVPPADVLDLPCNTGQNVAPFVEAGPDQANASSTTTLAGTVIDDGLPAPPVVSQTWTLVSGPGTVAFSSPTQINPTATFSAPGIYLLRLTASDGVLTSSDDVQISVGATSANTAPVVNAGPDRTIAFVSSTTQVALTGTVTDDGVPNPPGNTTKSWTKVSGPGTVGFVNPTSASTTATFSVPGVYVLRLSASDSLLSNSDDVQITLTGTARPCDGICANPTVFSLPGSSGTNYQSHDLGAGAVCRETTSVVTGGNCGNFAAGRTLKVNGVQKVCTYANWLIQPVPRNGGYCIDVSPGNHPYATFTLWN